MTDTKNGISNDAPGHRAVVPSPQNIASNAPVRSQANGTVRFGEDVIAAVAFLAATEVRGVAARIGKSDVTEDRMIKKNMLRGIRIRLNGNDVQIDMPITVKQGYKAVSVAQSVQSGVRANVENMTGLNVLSVNITVAAIQYKSGNE